MAQSSWQASSPAKEDYLFIMTEQQIHQIQNAAVTINLEQNMPLFDAFSAQQELLSWTKEQVLEGMDHHMDNLVAPQQFLEISTLSLELDLSEATLYNSSKREIQAVLWDQIYHQLRTAVQAAANSEISTPRAYSFELFIHYLKTGQLSELQLTKSWQQLVKESFIELEGSENATYNLTQILLNKDAFYRFAKLVDGSSLRKHLVRQFKSEELAEVLQTLMTVLKQDRRFVAPSDITELYFITHLTLAARSKSTASRLIPALVKAVLEHHLIGGTLKIEEIESEQAVKTSLTAYIEQRTLLKPNKIIEAASTTTVDETSGKDIQISQAGLVLLAAFLPQFFRSMGYLDADGNLNDQKQIPILLHYLCTAEATAPEWKLTLPKILAGLKPGQHVPTELKISSELDSKIKTFLTAVIGHWSALKNTSPAGLQQTFLTRPGLLKYSDGFYHLDVEQQTVDILLQFVPWNYSMIRLDWMQTVVFVNWKKT